MFSSFGVDDLGLIKHLGLGLSHLGLECDVELVHNIVVFDGVDQFLDPIISLLGVRYFVLPELPHLEGVLSEVLGKGSHMAKLSRKEDVAIVPMDNQQRLLELEVQIVLCLKVLFHSDFLAIVHEGLGSRILAEGQFVNLVRPLFSIGGNDSRPANINVG